MEPLTHPRWEALTAATQVAAIKYASIHSFAVTAIRGMAYFIDAERQPMPQMIDKTPWMKIRKFLEQKAVLAGRLHLEDLWE